MPFLLATRISWHCRCGLMVRNGVEEGVEGECGSVGMRDGIEEGI